MFQIINTDNLPRVRNYETALKVWEDAKPSRVEGKRCLNARRDTSRLVWKEASAIHFRFHRTDVVTWTSPDSLAITFWNSTSTALFAQCFLPSGLSITTTRGNMRANGMMPKYGSIRFRRIDDEWLPDEDDVRQEYRIVIDRKLAAAAQRKLKPYFAFRRARQALTNEVPRYATAARYIDLSALLNEPEKFAEHHKALCSVSDEVLLRSAAVCVGAVRKEPLPFGEVPTKSVYDIYTNFI